MTLRMQRWSGPADLAAAAAEGVAVLGMPEETYHAHPALSASKLKPILKSPRHFRASLAAPREDKPEFDFGSAVHSLVLGVGAIPVVFPHGMLSADGGVRSNAAKDWRDGQRAEGRLPLKPEQWARVKGAADSIVRNPHARRLLHLPRQSEVSLFATDPETGLALRGRLDVLAGRQIGDLKTTIRLEEHSLARVVDDLHYDLSCEMYRYLFELVSGEIAEPVELIWVEKEPPYDVRVTVLDDVWIEGGWLKLRRALEAFAAASSSGVWPGVDDEDVPARPLPAPGYYAARVRASGEEMV